MARKLTVPRKDAAIYDALSHRFRGGDLYAFSYDGAWETWTTEADWLATERNGQVARPDLAGLGHGPRTWDRAELVAWLGISPSPTQKRPGKAEYVELLRRIVEGVDWTVDEIDNLLGRELVR